MWTKRGHSKNHSHIRARLPGQNSRQHLAEVPIVHPEAVEQPRPNGGKPAQGSKRQLQIRTLLRYGNSQQHLAEGATLRREVEKLRRPNRNQCSAKLYERLHIRAQLHGQEPKQQLADVPKRRREGNELGQPNSIRTRQVSKRRCTSERSCTDKNQNSNWRMCQRGVGKATNSVSRKASERGKSAQRRCTSERSCTDKNQNSNWRMCQRSVGKATNSVSRKASERGKSAQMRCTSERSCTDKNQNSNWRMCQRGVRDGNELGQPKSVRARQGSRMQGENVPESQQEKKSLFLGFYSDPSALNRIRRSATRRTLTNSIISYLGSGEERAAHCMSEMAMYPHNMHGLSK